MIKEILEKIKPEERAKLNYAFEHGLTQFVILKDDYFVGVNTDSVKHLIVLESAGKWRYGRLRTANFVS